jgi:hypothetical protein
MASISSGKNGHRTVQFVDIEKKRRSIRLGKMSKREADTVKSRIERLLAAKISGCSWDNETAKWVAALPEEFADKLA